MADHDTHDHTGIPGISSGSVATDTIWDAAGDLAVGTGANTAARLAIGAAGGAVSRINGAVAWNSGTSNPGSAVAGDRYWRTDLGQEIYYDGTRWLTTTQYRADFQMASGISASAVVGRCTPHHTTYDLWLDSWLTSTISDSTTDGSNYWTVALRKITAAISVTTITSFNTDADTDGNYVTRNTSIGAAFGTSNKVLDILATKVSSPGVFTFAGCVLYRLIVT